MNKEEIFAEADNSDYLHGELYETSFESGNYSHTIFTKKRWKGKVKIVITSEEKQEMGQ